MSVFSLMSFLLTIANLQINISLFVDFTCKLDKSVILSYFFSIYVQKSEIGHYLNRVVEHHNICLSNRSKLRVERTRNSLARNLWVLRVQRYAACTQRVMCVLARVCNIIKQKSSPFRCNGTTFAFHLSLSCTAFVVLLPSKSTPFAQQLRLIL